MRLFITEKAPIGRVLGDYFGVIKKGDNFIESKAGYITWCRGHLIGTAPPGAYGYTSFPGDPKSLPIAPTEWKYVVNEDTKPLLETIRRLVNQKDVTEIIHAGDSGREGQLIVDEVLVFVGNTKPVKRLWVNAYNAAALDKGMAALKDNKSLHTLYQAAIARERADWLVGMNMSRLACMIAGTGVYSVGRVQTPVLALIAKRQREIEAFVPKDFFVPSLKVQVEKGLLNMDWTGHPDGPEKFFNKADADKVLSLVPEQVKLEVENKADPVPPPLPFCLATLQVWAAKAIGISPVETLDRLQELYINGYVTYPRVDCEYYPEEEWPFAKKILPLLAGYVPGANAAVSALKSRAWNSKKTEDHDHYALMPTDKIPATLSPGLKPLYEAIAKSYVAQFYPNLQLSRTKVFTAVNKHVFSTYGKVVVDPGWTVILGGGEKDTALPAVLNGEIGKILEKNILSRVTSPPKPFTEGGIIDAMRNIVRYLEDNPLAKKYLGSKDGLGRPSSQATIGETLLKREYVTLTGKGNDKVLFVTEKGFRLLDVVPEDVKDPIMTAFWERDFDRIQNKELTLEDFFVALNKSIKAWCDAGIPKIKSGTVWKTDVKTPPPGNKVTKGAGTAGDPSKSKKSQTKPTGAKRSAGAPRAKAKVQVPAII